MYLWLNTMVILQCDCIYGYDHYKIKPSAVGLQDSVSAGPLYFKAETRLFTQILPKFCMDSMVFTMF